MEEPFVGTFAVSEIESAIDVDAILLGVPFEDDLSLYPKGCVAAPQKIRANSNFFSGQGLTLESIHQRNFLDLGNLKVNGQSYDEIIINLKETVKQILAKKAKAVVLGGDHSIALGTAQAFLETYKSKQKKLVWIDAHLDLMDEYPEGRKKTRATVLKRILELELISPEEIYFIGCRGHNLGFEEIELLKELKMNALPASDFDELSLVTNFLKKVIKDDAPLYVSLDLDVLDPSFAPGVSVPEPGGLSARELFSIIRQLAKKINCLEIVELNPTRDFNDITSLLACKTLFHFADNMK